jgi:hypothetical protein
MTDLSVANVNSPVPLGPDELGGGTVVVGGMVVVVVEGG